MRNRVARRLSTMGLMMLLPAMAASGCNYNNNSSAPSPVQHNETFTGTLQPLGSDFKSFTVVFSAAPTNLSAIVNSLTAVSSSTPVTGVTIGLGFGGISSGACAVQILNPVTPLGQEQVVTGGVDAGTYCVRISDCPTGSTGCTSVLTEPVTYSLTVKHF
jgi:hypothetical protein